jgi:sulfur relay (sulfurtransferase) complex TusBCD TusD component (DsrE family)
VSHLCRGTRAGSDTPAAGVKIGTMPELADWTLEADKVVSF